MVEQKDDNKKSGFSFTKVGSSKPQSERKDQKTASSFVTKSEKEGGGKKTGKEGNGFLSSIFGGSDSSAKKPSEAGASKSYASANNSGKQKEKAIHPAPPAPGKTKPVKKQGDKGKGFFASIFGGGTTSAVKSKPGHKAGAPSSEGKATSIEGNKLPSEQKQEGVEAAFSSTKAQEADKTDILQGSTSQSSVAKSASMGADDKKDDVNLMDKDSLKSKEIHQPNQPVKAKAAGENGMFDKIQRFQEKSEKMSTPIIDKIDKAVKFLISNQYQPDGGALDATRNQIRLGVIGAIIVFGFFGSWSVLAPLESAAVARGTVVLDSNKKTVQHLEGGIISDILVREGQRVEKGDVLIRLSETAAKARNEILKTQYITALATKERLEAERDGTDLSFKDDIFIEDKDDPDVKTVLDTQRRLYEARQKSLQGELNVLDQRINQSKEEIGGLEAQKAAAKEQLDYLAEEIATVKKLLDKGQALRPRLLSLQRQQAEIRGRRGEYQAMMARAHKTITETELQKINTRNKRLGEIVDKLREAQTTVADLKERISASKDILKRIEITAPLTGYVTDLKFFTVGGVIGSGEPIMDIVPIDDELVIEARVSPQDIDVVHKGLKAKVRLSAFKARKVPMLRGEVVNVSADKFMDRATHQSFYKARIRIDPEILKKVKGIEQLYPGMPAEVLIVTGERTFLSYLISPITDSFVRAFREQ